MKKKILIFLIISYLAFVAVSFLVSYNAGITIGTNFYMFLLQMVKIIPCAFLLIGLFEVWVKKETVEKHLGCDRSVKGYLWSMLLASTTVGGMYVAFPVAYSLHKKGAALSIVFFYLGCAAVCRIPMTVFEASFLGIKFTVIRWIVSIVFIYISSRLMGRYFETKGYLLSEGK